MVNAGVPPAWSLEIGGTRCDEGARMRGCEDAMWSVGCEMNQVSIRAPSPPAAPRKTDGKR